MAGIIESGLLNSAYTQLGETNIVTEHSDLPLPQYIALDVSKGLGNAEKEVRHSMAC